MDTNLGKQLFFGSGGAMEFLQSQDGLVMSVFSRGRRSRTGGPLCRRCLSSDQWEMSRPFVVVHRSSPISKAKLDPFHRWTKAGETDSCWILGYPSLPRLHLWPLIFMNLSTPTIWSHPEWTKPQDDEPAPNELSEAFMKNILRSRARRHRVQQTH